MEADISCGSIVAILIGCVNDFSSIKGFKRFGATILVVFVLPKLCCTSCKRFLPLKAIITHCAPRGGWRYLANPGAADLFRQKMPDQPLTTTFSTTQQRNTHLFVQCAGSHGRPALGQKSKIKSHVMRVHRSKGRPQSREALTASADTHGSSSRPDEDSEDWSLETRHALDDDDDDLRARIASWYSTRGITSVEASAQIKLQIRDVYGRIFSPHAPRTFLEISPESVVNERTLVPTVSCALDACIFLYIAAVQSDRRCLSQAMTCYQVALARLRSIFCTAITLPSLDGLIVAVFLLAIFETMVSSDYPGHGYTQHIRAFSVLMKAKRLHHRAPLDPEMQALLRNRFWMGLELSLVTRDGPGIMPQELPSIIVEADLPLFEAIAKGSSILRRLLSSHSPMQRDTGDQERHGAFQLWLDVEAQYKAWIGRDQARDPSTADVKDFPTFYLAVGSELCEQIERAYVFANLTVVLVHREVWTVLMLLGNYLKLATLSYSRDACVAPVVNETGILHFSIDFLQTRVDLFANNLCCMLPYMLEHLGGVGRINSRAILFHLRRFYLDHQNKALSNARVAFLAQIQDAFLPSVAIERMLGT